MVQLIIRPFVRADSEKSADARNFRAFARRAKVSKPQRFTSNA
jgi:hypothetical protein